VIAFGGQLADDTAGITPEDRMKLLKEAFPHRDSHYNSVGNLKIDVIRKNVVDDLHEAEPESWQIMAQELAELAGGSEEDYALAGQVAADLRTAKRLYGIIPPLRSLSSRAIGGGGMIRQP